MIILEEAINDLSIIHLILHHQAIAMTLGIYYYTIILLLVTCLIFWHYNFIIAGTLEVVIQARRLDFIDLLSVNDVLAIALSSHSLTKSLKQIIST